MNYLKDEGVKRKIFIGIVLISFFFVMFYIKNIWDFLGTLVNVLGPFIVGSAIAFVINVPMSALEKHIFGNEEKFSGPKWALRRRVIAMIITFLIAIILIALILYMLIPQLAQTIGQLLKQIPEGINQVTMWANKQFGNNETVMGIIDDLVDNWQNLLEKTFGILKNSINSIVEGGINAVSGIVSGVVSFIIGIVFSIYVLAQKDSLGTHAKKIIYAVFEKNKADWLMRIAKLSSKTFANFISGQCVEALILASMFCLSMTIFRLPYAMLVGVLIGVLSLVPIVGSFIGCAIGALLIILVDPMKALVFVILFIVLQQIEGNLIYPKVVGSSVGLPGIWVLVSVTVGGSLFGVGGMIVVIPLVSIFYTSFRSCVYDLLRNKNMLDGHDLVVPVVDVSEEDVMKEESNKPRRVNRKSKRKSSNRR